MTEETGINAIERRAALRLAFQLCVGIKSGSKRKTDTQRNEINYNGRTCKKRSTMGEQEKREM